MDAILITMKMNNCHSFIQKYLWQCGNHRESEIWEQRQRGQPCSPPLEVQVCPVDTARTEGEGEEGELCWQLPLIASLSSSKATKISTSVIWLAKQTAAHSSKAVRSRSRLCLWGRWEEMWPPSDLCTYSRATWGFYDNKEVCTWVVIVVGMCKCCAHTLMFPHIPVYLPIWGIALQKRVVRWEITKRKTCFNHSLWTLCDTIQVRFKNNISRLFLFLSHFWHHVTPIWNNVGLI